jgi:hypothetical protein
VEPIFGMAWQQDFIILVYLVEPNSIQLAESQNEKDDKILFKISHFLPLIQQGQSQIFVTILFPFYLTLCTGWSHNIKMRNQFSRTTRRL